MNTETRKTFYQDGADFYLSDGQLRGQYTPVASYPELVKNDSDLEGAIKARTQFLIDHPEFFDDEVAKAVCVKTGATAAWQITGYNAKGEVIDIMEDDNLSKLQTLFLQSHSFDGAIEGDITFQLITRCRHESVALGCLWSTANRLPDSEEKRALMAGIGVSGRMLRDMAAKAEGR